MGYGPTADQVHGKFRRLPGATEIVSRFALNEIWRLYRERKPDALCEVGHGIGSITYLLASWRLGLLTAVEDNPWCIEQARQNLGDLAGSVLWYDKFPLYETYDMVLVDGPQVAAQHWQACLAPRALVIFEGNRRGQRAILEAVLRTARRPFCRVNLKPPDRTKGLWIYQLEPTWRERGRMWASGIRELLSDTLRRLNGKPVGKRRRP